MATDGKPWHAPAGDRPTKDRLGDAQRGCGRWWSSRPATSPNAWALHRLGGLPCRVRDVYRATGGLTLRNSAVDAAAGAWFSFSSAPSRSDPETSPIPGLADCPLRVEAMPPIVGMSLTDNALGRIQP